MSLWAPGSPGSIFSEFQIQEPVYTATPYTLRILTLLIPALEPYLQPGKTILFGLFPHAAGEGRIISVEPIQRGPAVWVTPKKPNGSI
ncbi:hypothetical protein GCM10023186_05270 [Hymenobacter koreensis]|uniref:Uncharacterized protein n=2 Tax=Hymenobacter koreensis TaxID=1084523 RepID=A0ABP8IV99_9BACT